MRDEPRNMTGWHCAAAAAIAVVVLIIVCFALFAHGQQPAEKTEAPPPVSADEYAIYSAFLRQNWMKESGWKPAYLVVASLTTDNPLQDPDDAANEAKYIRDKLGVETALITQLKALNAKPSSIDAHFDLPIPVRIVTEEQLHRYFAAPDPPPAAPAAPAAENSDNDDGGCDVSEESEAPTPPPQPTDRWWPAFYKDFPDSGGFMSFSRVAFSSDGNRALFYFSHNCGGLCGSGHYVLMKRTPAGWKLDKITMVWIS